MPASLLRQSHRSGGFSLPEIMVSIAVVGILTAIGLVSLTNVRDSAEETRARHLVEQLNNGLKGFSQANWTIATAVDSASVTDDLKVLRSLQYKPPAQSGRFTIGAPYFTPKWNPTGSNVSSTYRAQWNGFVFKLLTPGAAGMGLKITVDGSDYSQTDYSFPNGYKPEGAP
jgi:prepilin-type N-terminal cleavage/methylation domain-containing protein